MGIRNDLPETAITLAQPALDLLWGLQVTCRDARAFKSVDVAGLFSERKAKVSGVYAIRWLAANPRRFRGRWLYVGQSIDVFKRLRTHYSAPSLGAFSSWRGSRAARLSATEAFVALVPTHKLNHLEALFIGSLLPVGCGAYVPSRHRTPEQERREMAAATGEGLPSEREFWLLIANQAAVNAARYTGVTGAA
jgi:hypothetical protein